MNLLVTNTRNGQAYCIIRSLRKHARKIVATVYGKNRFVARLSPAALSRFVDKVYHVPSLVEDWRRGSFEDGATEAADNYIREVLKICKIEGIDVVFPSWDPQICAFSRSKGEFTQRGITLPVPEWPVLAKLVDKYRLMQEAAATAFPCPKSFLPKDEEEALKVARQLGFPVVVKPRFSSGSRGTCLAQNEVELITSIKKLVPIYGAPMVQEYIPGGNTGLVNLIVVLDHRYQLCAFHSRRVIRSVSRRFTSTTSAEICMHDPLLVERAAELLRSLGYYGHAAFQLQHDPRDGIAKLLEINCRLSYRAWCESEIGLNLPLLTLQVERGENIVPTEGCRYRALFIYPVEDSIGRLMRVPRSHSASSSAASRDSSADFAFRPNFSDWYFKSLWTDPLHALAWYGSRFISIVREMRQPGVNG